MAKAMFGAGCFWGVETAFRKLRGVADVSVGYSGGTTENPTYEDVCTGTTGHAEVVMVDYDENRVSYENLLELFWQIHDPTQLNRQGPDTGTQYRSAIFTFDDAQKEIAERSKAMAAEHIRGNRPIATEITPSGPYWRAEDYHQRFEERRMATTARL
ncbi:MAG: peptide-methionine (S)-S-oxide reductase MsrA [Alphaproteobacteria bacterium]|nr:peptide-methionine (S)-S-oxide reductase MsrA [Alphaproteobacteria bacterium]